MALPFIIALLFPLQEKDMNATEFNYNNLVPTVFNLFLAGTETTSSTIRYALSVLIKNPDMQGGCLSKFYATQLLCSVQLFSVRLLMYFPFIHLRENSKGDRQRHPRRSQPQNGGQEVSSIHRCFSP